MWSGHLGITKTYRAILRHFYWPGLKSDISKYCRTCHVCQVVGKPNQIVPPAPLHPIPVMAEPFERVIIDCVGPLPRTKSGNQYLLTIMCAATRYPEAVLLRSITAKSVVKALLRFFSISGLPRVIQTDQGSNFKSGLFRQVLKSLSVHHVVSSAYHPQSQEALEPAPAHPSVRLPNSEMLANLSCCLQYLMDEQQHDPVALVDRYHCLFSDIPTRTSVLKHDIGVNDARPIKQHAYRVNQTKRQLVKQEVEYLLPK